MYYERQRTVESKVLILYVLIPLLLFFLSFSDFNFCEKAQNFLSDHDKKKKKKKGKWKGGLSTVVEWIGINIPILNPTVVIYNVLLLDLNMIIKALYIS